MNESVETFAALEKESAPDPITQHKTERSKEAEKLEWGPEFGEMSWNDAWDKTNALNAGLEKGEKRWRLPHQSELLAEFGRTKSTPSGFEAYGYWSGNQDYTKGSVHSPNHYYYVSMNTGQIGSSMHGKFKSRPVRDK